MNPSVVKVVRNKETHLVIKIDHSKRKTNFLKEIVKYIMSRDQLFMNIRTSTIT